jgi:hypothetical protein
MEEGVFLCAFLNISTIILNIILSVTDRIGILLSINLKAMYDRSKKSSKKPSSVQPHKALESFDRMQKNVTQRKLQEIANDYTQSKWTGNVDGTTEATLQQKRLNGMDSSQQPSSEIPANDVVQRKIKVKEKDGIATATGDGDRPAGPLSGGSQGDHTTPYVTFEHQMINAIYGMNLPTAWKSLLATHRAIAKLPGYAMTAKWLTNQSDVKYEENSEVNPKHVTIDDIGTYANFLLEVRNRLALTSLPTSGGSTGGRNEATHAGGLQEEEKNIRNEKDPKYEKTDIMSAMIKLLDHDRLERSVKDSDKKDMILDQHIKSILDSYWRVTEAYGISEKDLLNYYNKYSW